VGGGHHGGGFGGPGGRPGKKKTKKAGCFSLFGLLGKKKTRRILRGGGGRAGGAGFRLVGPGKTKFPGEARGGGGARPPKSPKPAVWAGEQAHRGSFPLGGRRGGGGGGRWGRGGGDRGPQGGTTKRGKRGGRAFKRQPLFFTLSRGAFLSINCRSFPGKSSFLIFRHHLQLPYLRGAGRARVSCFFPLLPGGCVGGAPDFFPGGGGGGGKKKRRPREGGGAKRAPRWWFFFL